MVAMWVIAAISLVLGRVYCAYACPQMIFSELAHDFDELGRRLARRLAPPWRKRAARGVAYALVAVLSVVATALIMAYFAPLARRAAAPGAPRRRALGGGRRRHPHGPGLPRPGPGARELLPHRLPLRPAAGRDRGRPLAARAPGAGAGAVHRLRRLRARLPDGDRHPGRRLPDRVHALRQPAWTPARRCCAAQAGPPRACWPSTWAARARGWDLKRTLVAVSTLGFGLALVVAVARRQPVSFQLSPVYSAAAEGRPPRRRGALPAARHQPRPRACDPGRARRGAARGQSVEGLGDGRCWRPGRSALRRWWCGCPAARCRPA